MKFKAKNLFLKIDSDGCVIVGDNDFDNCTKGDFPNVVQAIKKAIEKTK